MSSTYTKTVVCRNCFHKEVVEIPKGKSEIEWIRENPVCPNCGCGRRRVR